MAIYDPESKKLIVRVVYDGPGMAGKTTNLQQICTTFPPERRSDLYNGLTSASRTLCLDWMQLDGGRVRGHELRCHLLTVPGQTAFERRRQMLLSMADSVVFVVDSSEGGLDEALPMWRSLLACTGGTEAGVPVLIQANKQDLPAALAPADIRRRWRLDPALPVIAANAEGGHGVRETVVLAVRAALVLLQEDLDTSAIGDLEGSYETGQELERRIMAAERANPSSGDAFRASLRPVPAAGADPEPADDARRAPDGTTSASQRAPSKRSTRSGVFAAPSTPRPAHAPAARRWPGKVALPSADAGTGLVWPAIEGRRILRRIPFLNATRQRTKRASGARDGGRASDAIIFKAGIWRLKGSLERCFPSAAEAQNALVRLAHAKLELGAFCVPRTVLVVQRAADDSHWLWTISPWLETLASQFDHALEQRDEGLLSEAASQYARLLVRALRMCLDQGVVLDLRPRAFGLSGDEVFYLEDELERGTRAPLAGQAMLAPFEECAALPGALRGYEELLLHELGSQITVEEADRLGLARGLETATVNTEAGKRAKNQLRGALIGPRKAAR